MYHSMHSSVGFFLTVAIAIPLSTFIPFPLYAWVLLLVAPSHFVCDKYKDWYPKGGWAAKGKTPKEKLLYILRTHPQWVALLGTMMFIIQPLFIYFMSKYISVYPLILAYFAANFVDYSEILYRVIKKDFTKSFWFCHPGGWFPLKVPAGWQKGKYSANKAFILELVVNFLIMGSILAYYTLRS